MEFEAKSPNSRPFIDHVSRMLFNSPEFVVFFLLVYCLYRGEGFLSLMVVSSLSSSRWRSSSLQLLS
jgi:hypothetical protein